MAFSTEYAGQINRVICIYVSCRWYDWIGFSTTGTCMYRFIFQIIGLSKKGPNGFLLRYDTI